MLTAATPSPAAAHSAAAAPATTTAAHSAATATESTAASGAGRVRLQLAGLDADTYRLPRRCLDRVG